MVEYDLERFGRGAARNRGIDRVQTEWTAFLDDDDHITPDYAQKLSLHLRADPDTDVVIFRLRRPAGYVGMWPDEVLPRTPEIIEGNVGINFCLRTDLAKTYAFTNDEHNQDSGYLKTLEKAGARIVFSPYITYLVRDAKKERN